MQLNEKYNREDFLDFLINHFLTDFEKDIRPVNTQSLTVIKSATYLGQSKSLDLHIFELSYSESHANKRIALAMDGFRIMKSTATFNALIIFNPQNKNNWRLSLMSASPEKNEKGGVLLHLSNPHRFSFSLGENTKINTPHNFLIKKGKVSDFDDLRKRFSIEVVNKEFYTQIAELFTELVGGTRGEGRNQRKYPGIIALPSVPKESRENHEFAVRLIGRIIFCWFLREKKSISDLPLISKEILSLEAANTNPDYYHSVLEPLFFEVLNKPSKLRGADYRNSLFGKTPYLNGGLFTPQTWDYYDSKLRFILNIPDEWIRKLFEVLELYNFTVDENTSIDVDLSIDPEMLGRIFENLLAEINPETGETARKATGSYYTPRTIVDYMVDESLVQYLKDKTDIDESSIRVLVSYDLNDDEDYPLNEDEKNKVVESLSKITILDPACGSGAFPIGALQKIVFILQRIDLDAKLWFKQQIEGSAPEIKRIIEREFAERNFDYIRKLGIIRQSIFGVDIQPVATEIARLRCFLTLVVDERVIDSEDNRGIEPLPNLDFKFVTANSLIGLPSSQANSQVGLFEDQEGINKLKEVRDKYFNASGTEREQLKEQFVQIQNSMFQKMINEHRYAELTQKLSSWNPFGHEASDWFDPDWMFGIKEGFDIMIANPPYVGQKGNKHLFDSMKNNSCFEKKMDLWYFFLHLAYELNKSKGVTTFVTTNYWTSAQGGKKLRKRIVNDYSIIEWINFNENKIFEAGVHANVFVLQKQAPSDNNIKCTIFKNKYEGDFFEHRDKEINFVTKQSLIFSQWTGFVHFLHANTLSIVNKLIINSEKLSDDESEGKSKKGITSGKKVLNGICYVNQGLVTGNDEVFILNEDEIQKLHLSIIERAKIVNFYKNSDVKRYYVSTKPTYFLLYVNNINNETELKSLPNLYTHLNKYKNVLKKRSVNGVLESAYKKGKWWALTTDRPNINFSGDKIVFPQRSSKNTFGFSDTVWYAASDVFYISQNQIGYNLKFILSLINSNLIYFWLYHMGKRKGETLELTLEPIQFIPIKKTTHAEQIPFVKIVEKILSITKSNDYIRSTAKQTQVKEYENQIDQMVYKLYCLTPKEIKIVENDISN